MNKTKKLFALALGSAFAVAALAACKPEQPDDGGTDGAPAVPYRLVYDNLTAGYVDASYTELALEGIELNENYQSIAYDAVLNCRKFAGYTQEEGCEKFVLSDGVLFEEGKALLSLYWMQNNDVLVLPRGVPDIQLFCEQSASQREGFSSVLLNEDVQSISARGVPFINYELAEESTFLKAEQGILFSADGTKLLSCPKLHSEYEYAVSDTVTEIADYAFEGVENISFVALGAQTQKIGAYAFLNASLRRIDFGDSLAFIGQHAFSGADIRTVELPDSVQTLG